MPKQLEVPTQGSLELGSPEFKLKSILMASVQVRANVSPSGIMLQLYHVPGTENLQELGQDL